MAAWSGIPTVIADASSPTAAVGAVSGEEVGTWIEPHDSKLTAKKLWIAFGLPAAGRMVVDAGAAAALVERGGSLLAAGITEIEGEFGSGAAVEVVTGDGALVGKGLAGLSATELREALGRHSSEAGGEAIHRDDLVVLA
jgi:glutamate 5-kinase